MPETAKIVVPPKLHEFCENRSRFAADELSKYTGKHVAWRADGTSIITSGANFEELERELERLGIDPSEVVLGFVDPPDEAYFA